MKKILHIGSFFSVILALVFFTDVFFAEEMKEFVGIIGFSFKSEIILASTIFFLFFLKKHANLKHYIHSEELKFLLLISLLIINQAIRYLVPNISSHSDTSLIMSFAAVILFNLLKLMLEFNIYSTLRRRVKDRLYIISMFIFQVAVILAIIGIISSQFYTLLHIINIHLEINNNFINVSAKVIASSKFLYFIAYTLITFVFLKPKEKYSF